MIQNASSNLNNSMNLDPCMPEKGKGRFPVNLTSTFERMDMNNDIPLQTWSSPAGPVKTSNLPPLYRPSDPVMDDYMRANPRGSAGDMPPRPTKPWYKREWPYLVAFIISIIGITTLIVIALEASHQKHQASAHPTDILTSSLTMTETKQIPAIIVTDITTESLTIPIFSQSATSSLITQSQGFPPLTTLTTKVTSTELRNTVIPILRPSNPPSTSTSTIVQLETDTTTVIANPITTTRGRGNGNVARKLTVSFDNHIYTTVTDTITDTITTTRTFGRWITETRASRTIESAAVTPAPSAEMEGRGIFDWARKTTTRTETVHTKITVTVSTTTLNTIDSTESLTILYSPSISNTSVKLNRRRTLPPNVIDLPTCQIAYNGKPTSNQRCHGLCDSGYCYLYWNVIPCDQWSCCESCGCYNNTYTPSIAVNASIRGMSDCRSAAIPNMNVTNSHIIPIK